MDQAVAIQAITITATPRPAQLVQFWTALRNDPKTRGSYMDTLPQHLEVFLAPTIMGDMYVWLIEADGECAGAHWIHDCAPCGTGRCGWVAGYYLPDYRGRLGLEPLRQVIAAAQRVGIQHFFTGVRCGNQAAFKLAVKFGFHHVGVVRDFGWFEGRLDHLDLFTLDPADTAQAWLMAERRAAFHRTNPPMTR